MNIISVILLQYQKKVLIDNFRWLFVIVQLLLRCKEWRYMVKMQKL